VTSRPAAAMIRTLLGALLLPGEIVGELLNVAYAGINNLLPCDLFNGSLVNAGTVRDLLVSRR